MLPIILALAGFSVLRFLVARIAVMQHIGDIIKVSVKEAIPRGKVKKGDVLTAVVVRTRKGVSSSRWICRSVLTATQLLCLMQTTTDWYAYLWPGDS